MAKGNLTIYIPGLGDDKMVGNSLLQKFWRLFGINTKVHKLYWRDSRPYSQKLDELLSEIDQLANDGYRVSLIGTSAGASMALNVYARRKATIHKAVFICGKLSNFEVVNPRYYQKNPALKESFADVPANLKELSAADKAKMLTLNPLKDWLVPAADTKIPGVRSQTILSIGHLPSIVIANLFYFDSIARFIKN